MADVLEYDPLELKSFMHDPFIGTWFLYTHTHINDYYYVCPVWRRATSDCYACVRMFNSQTGSVVLSVRELLHGDSYRMLPDWRHLFTESQTRSILIQVKDVLRSKPQ